MISKINLHNSEAFLRNQSTHIETLSQTELESLDSCENGHQLKKFCKLRVMCIHLKKHRLLKGSSEPLISAEVSSCVISYYCQEI